MRTIEAEPFPFQFEPRTTALVVIDMQSDFIEPGGFGESLGNDVARLAAIVPTVARLIAGCRHAGVTVIYTLECHRPDLTDCPPSKRSRGNPTARIGDPGPMGRLLIAGEPGTDIIDALAPVEGERVIEKPGKGAFYRTDLDAVLASLGVRALLVSRASPRKCAFRPRCARQTTAAMTACWSRTQLRAISRSSRPRRWRWTRARCDRRLDGDIGPGFGGACMISMAVAESSQRRPQP